MHKLAVIALAALLAPPFWICLEAGPSPETPAVPVEARQFWSLRPIQNPEPPIVRNTGWPSTPIDRFILAKLEEHGLEPNPDADRTALIRRTTFNLTGLPPTPEEVRTFLSDPAPDAFEKLVDRLLASPRYGERWGRHWLDVVRYADTSGCNSDFPVPAAYKYRDYVIQAFNDDKPYDQFIREQIAGDLLPASDSAQHYRQIIATGYLAISRRFGSRADEFHLTLEDILDNMGKSMLGLSLSCARCHDHKYDPIPIEDYYALYGIFNSTRFAFPGTEIYRQPKDFVPLAPPDIAERVRQRQAELAGLDDQIERLRNDRRALARALKAAEESGDENQVQSARTALDEAVAALQSAQAGQKELEENRLMVELAYAVSEGEAANAKVHQKGNPRQPGAEVPRGFPQILGGRQLTPGTDGSGRLELASWLTDPENPLTARVMVNRIWQHHFGKGIVQTPNDFGVRGERPTHPELLDYLAARFIESGWSIKAMHKQIVLSRAYQISSEHVEEKARLDANNQWLWQFERRRLAAEEIRDAILAVSGGLDLAPGRPHPFPPEHEWRYTQHVPFVDTYESHQRTVYLMQQRIKKEPFLEIFDGADPNASTGLRPQTTTPIQALFLMNNSLVHEQSRLLAERLLSKGLSQVETIDYAHQLAFARLPTQEERQFSLDYLEALSGALREADRAESGNGRASPGEHPVQAAWSSFGRVLFSSNEFIFIE